MHIIVTHLAVVRQWLIMYSVLSVCLSVCNRFCKQGILKTNSWIIAKFIGDNPSILP